MQLVSNQTSKSNYIIVLILSYAVEPGNTTLYCRSEVLFPPQHQVMLSNLPRPTLCSPYGIISTPRIIQVCRVVVLRSQVDKKTDVGYRANRTASAAIAPNGPFKLFADAAPVNWGWEVEVLVGEPVPEAAPEDDGALVVE